jgi:ketosteroid isomerase-like protein
MQALPECVRVANRVFVAIEAGVLVRTFMYNMFFPQFSSVEQTVSTEEVEVAGDWAFAWATEHFVLVPQVGGPPIEMDGKDMSILRRPPDGSWKFARGINNTVPRTAPKTD